jgi:VIT1/CCC1 family predicted Fe2+/Mn2+ transporter
LAIKSEKSRFFTQTSTANRVEVPMQGKYFLLKTKKANFAAPTLSAAFLVKPYFFFLYAKATLSVFVAMATATLLVLGTN